VLSFFVAEFWMVKAGILLFSAQNAWTICGEFVVLVMVFAGVKTTTQ
jgi:hypothetical protein